MGEKPITDFSVIFAQSSPDSFSQTLSLANHLSPFTSFIASAILIQVSATFKIITY